MKELPIVLILRPFNFATLSTTVFQYAHDEMIPESSLASLLIIALTLIPTGLVAGSQALARRNGDDVDEGDEA